MTPTTSNASNKQASSNAIVDLQAAVGTALGSALEPNFAEMREDLRKDKKEGVDSMIRDSRLEVELKSRTEVESAVTAIGSALKDAYFELDSAEERVARLECEVAELKRRRGKLVGKWRKGERRRRAREKWITMEGKKLVEKFTGEVAATRSVLDGKIAEGAEKDAMIAGLQARIRVLEVGSRGLSLEGLSLS